MQEVQFSFLILIYGENYEGLERWKLLIHLICFSDELILQSFESPSTLTQLYIDFITILCEQLKVLPKDFFIDVLSQENFMQFCIKNLFRVCSSLGDNSVLNMLRDCLESQFKWDIQNLLLNDQEEEDDEYKPVVV